MSNIKELEIYNLDGFGNYAYKDDPFNELTVQLVAISTKLNEVIKVVNALPTPNITSPEGQKDKS